MKKLFSPFFLLIVFAPAVYGQLVDFSQLVNKSHTERTVALFDYYGNQIRSLDSAAVYQEIELVNQLADKHNDEDIRLEAFLIEAHYFAYNKSLSNKEVYSKILTLTKEAESYNKLWLTARLHSLIAGVMEIRNQHALSFKHYYVTNDLLKDVSSKEYPIKPICLVHQGMIHLTFKEYKESNKLFQKALKDEGLYYYTMLGYSGLANNYRSMNMLDSSNFWYEKLLQEAVDSKDNTWQFIASGNLGENLCLVAEYEQAKPLLRIDLRGSENAKSWGNASNAAAFLGEAFFETDNIDSAKHYLQLALRYAHQSEEIKRLSVVYPKMTKLYSRLNNHALAEAYVDSALLSQDSVSKVFDRLVLNRVEQELELEKIANQSALLEEKRNRQITQRNLTILVLVFAFIAGLLMLNRRRLKALAAKQKAESEYEVASSKLSEFVTQMQLKNAELQQVSAELNELKSEPVENPIAESELDELKQSTILTKADWQDFQELFEKVYPGYLGRLADKHPELTKAEIRFLALRKISLTPKQITATLGVGDNAVRQYRLRIKKKLGLSPDDELASVIESI
ncbi:MAG: helix-turn-helix transcriptional regulator [Flavobacteriales bacterium]